MGEPQAFAALDRLFALRCSGPLRAVLTDALHDLLVDEQPQHRLSVRRTLSRRWRVRWDRTNGYVGSDAHLALYDALITLNDQAASCGAETGPVLHGGCVEVDGRAVALVGHSGAGKSTLTAALVRAGHGYIADEVTAVSPDLFARPFHRPIGLRPNSVALLGVDHPEGPFETIYPLRVGGGWGPLSNGAHLAAVFLVQRGPDMRLSADAIRPAEALFRLANETLGGTGAETTMFRRLERLVHQVPVMHLAYREVEQAVEFLPGVVPRYA